MPRHVVTVYPDPLGGSWSDPIGSNPHLDLDAAGWREGPFTTAWTWAAGAVSGGRELARTNDPAYGIPRPPDASLYRLRLTFTTRATGPVFFGVRFGATVAAAWSGPYWSPNEADHVWAARGNLPAGSYTIEQTFDPAGMDPAYQWIAPYVSFQTYEQEATVSSIELTYRGDPGLDISCLVDEVTIAHGRDGAAGQPEPSTATLDLSAGAAGDLGDDVDVGAVVIVTTAGTDGAVSTRFAGRLTDLALGWADEAERTPDAGVAQIIAAGELAELGRRVIGSEPWPAELDGARVGRALAAAGYTLDPVYSDPGTVELLAVDVDARPALDVIHEAASSAGGILWQTRDGAIRYADADHRRGARAALALDACDLDVTPTWRRNLDGLVNVVSIGYGATPDEGEQPRWEGRADASVARYGRYELSASTTLAAADDAARMGNLLLARNASPVWVMAALPVDALDLDPDRYDTLLALDMHDLVELTGLPAIGTAPTSAQLWVEGWRERITADSHTFELVVSGYCRTSPPPTWDDLTPDLTWDTFAASTTWDEAACLGPPADLGRWVDQPASLRWDQVDPATTWDTYGPFDPPEPPPVVEVGAPVFRAALGDPADSAVYTFAGVDLGAPSPSRYVVVTASCRKAGSGAPAATVTIAGVDATVDAYQTNSFGNATIIARALVPAGAAGDVVVTWSTPVLRCQVGVWTIEHADEVVDSRTASAPAVAVTLTGAGALVAVAAQTSIGSWDWGPDVVERFDMAVEAFSATGADTLRAGGALTIPAASLDNGGNVTAGVIYTHTPA